MVKQLIAGGGILIVALLLFYQYISYQEPTCRVCLRPIHRVTSYFVTLATGEVVELCCPRCGMRFQKQGGRVQAVEVTSYNNGQRIDPSEAVYVEGSSIHLCCSSAPVVRDVSGSEYERTWDRCLPSLIAFETRQAALEFQREYGGELQAYIDLVNE